MNNPRKIAGVVAWWSCAGKHHVDAIVLLDEHDDVIVVLVRWTSWRSCFGNPFSTHEPYSNQMTVKQLSQELDCGGWRYGQVDGQARPETLVVCDNSLIYASVDVMAR